MKRYGWLLIVAAVAIVAGVIGWQQWNSHKTQQGATAAERYITAIDTIEQAQTVDPAAQIAPLQQLAASASAPAGYRTLAALRAAGLKAAAGDLPGAVAMWNQVAADSTVDPLLRDLASLMATEHDPAQLTGRLEPLALPGAPWSALAREQLAILDLRLGKTQDAKAKLHALSIDIEAPSGVRQRANALLAGLG